MRQVITLIAAHRGGAGLRPENSRAAFDHAIRLGVDQIETDLQFSSDGEPVLIHDPTLDRTTTARGSVAHRSWTELKHVRLRGTCGETIPHLGELLALLRPTSVGLRLELKGDHAPHRDPSLFGRAIWLLKIYQMLDRTTVSSFGWTCLAAFRMLARPHGTIGLVRRQQYDELGLSGVLGLARACGLDEIGLHAAQFCKDTLARAAEQGIRVGLYRVDHPEQIEAALRASVSAFTTDRPDLAVEIRKSLYCQHQQRSTVPGDPRAASG